MGCTGSKATKDAVAAPTEQAVVDKPTPENTTSPTKETVDISKLEVKQEIPAEEVRAQ